VGWLVDFAKKMTPGLRERTVDHVTEGRRCYNTGFVVLAIVIYIVIMVVLVTLMMVAVFTQFDNNGELCAVIVAFWMLVGCCVWGRTNTQMREKHSAVSVPPTYSDSEEDAERGRCETDALLGAVSVRAGVGAIIRTDSVDFRNVSLSSPESPAPSYDCIRELN
jgi:hypothetical protein